MSGNETTREAATIPPGLYRGRQVSISTHKGVSRLGVRLQDHRPSASRVPSDVWGSSSKPLRVIRLDRTTNYGRLVGNLANQASMHGIVAEWEIENLRRLDGSWEWLVVRMSSREQYIRHHWMYANSTAAERCDAVERACAKHRPMTVDSVGQCVLSRRRTH